MILSAKAIKLSNSTILLPASQYFITLVSVFMAFFGSKINRVSFKFSLKCNARLRYASISCVSVCGSVVCWCGQLQWPQRSPRPSSLSGTQWVINPVDKYCHLFKKKSFHCSLIQWFLRPQIHPQICFQCFLSHILILNASLCSLFQLFSVPLSLFCLVQYQLTICDISQNIHLQRDQIYPLWGHRAKNVFSGSIWPTFLPALCALCI